MSKDIYDYDRAERLRKKRYKSMPSFLSPEELEKKSTQRLLNLLRLANAVISHIRTYAGARCCEVCNEYIGDNWEEDVDVPAKLFVEYKEQIKSILATREHLQ